MKKDVVILGAGIGGLAAGWMLARTGKFNVIIVERAPEIGGVCGTFGYEKFLLDYGPHKAYSAIPGILEELCKLMGDEFVKHEKRNAIYLFGSYLKYPLSMIDLAPKMGIKNIIQSSQSAIMAMVRSKKSFDARSYEEYVVSKFGDRLYKLVFEQLAGKIWGDPSTLSPDIARTRIPSKSILDTTLRAIGFKKESKLTDAKYFYYPRKGFGRIPERMAEEIRKQGGMILAGTVPQRILFKGPAINGVRIRDEKNMQTLPCDFLISSIPLDALVMLLGGNEDESIRDVSYKAKKLQYRTAFLIYVFLQKDSITNHHWLFFPERDVVFSRVFEQKRMSEEMVPQGQTVLCCDFTDFEGGKLWSLSDEQLAELCIRDLEKVGIIEKTWARKTLVKRLPNFYPRYDLLYKETISDLYHSLNKFDNLLCTGRVGFYNYNNCDHCVDMGKFIAENLEQGKKTSQIWADLEQRVSNYKIVD